MPETCGSPGTHQRHGCSAPGRQADARRLERVRGRRRAVVADPHAPVRGHQVGAVERAVQAERLAQLGRPAAQVAVAADPGPGGSHRVEAGERGQRPQQHGHALALVAAHDVGAPVHAVGEVHVEAAGRAEHRAVARRHAAEGVAPGIGGAAVGLDLDDAARCAPRPPGRRAPGPCRAGRGPGRGDPAGTRPGASGDGGPGSAGAGSGCERSRQRGPDGGRRRGRRDGARRDRDVGDGGGEHRLLVDRALEGHVEAGGAPAAERPRRWRARRRTRRRGARSASPSSARCRSRPPGSRRGARAARRGRRRRRRSGSAR